MTKSRARIVRRCLSSYWSWQFFCFSVLLQDFSLKNTACILWQTQSDVYGIIDRRLSFAIWISNASLILSYFFAAASYSGVTDVLESQKITGLFLISVAALFAIIIETVIIQQKCVDATKKINPEKAASVYDMKFQKKWIGYCDEAERLLIGKCAFKAYNVTNRVCAVLAGVLAVCALIFGIGFLPSLSVCLIWSVNQSAYYREAIKYSKAGNKIS